jgi:lincosamide nucleotidyltransferase A/C/D/E
VAPEERYSFPMISRDVLALYEQTNGAGITIWIDGGWGVDALLGKQTRAHEDLDIVIERKDVPAFRVLLERQGYTETRVEYARPWNFVLGSRARSGCARHCL